MTTYLRRTALALAFPALLGGCSDGPTEPEIDPGATLTVDASSSDSWVYVDLGSSAQVVSVTDPSASTAWDLAFQVTKVAVNGGSAGPAGMTVYCICQNSAATTEEIMAMSLESEGAEFDAVTSADIPATGALWNATVFDDQAWYGYNLTGSDHQIWPTFDVYLVRRGSDVWKLQVVGYYGPNGETRQISFRYARLTGS